MRSHEEIEAAQAKFLAVQTGAVTMPDEFYGPTNNYRLGCMVKELARILALAPGETVEARRADVHGLLVKMITASPKTRASLGAYHHVEEVMLPKWCVNLIAMVNVLDWALGNPDGEAIAENLSAIDAYSAIGNDNEREA
ncbi:MAG: hypothetical protein ABSC64_19960 [Candidatus Korobacteraceae bacterium]|jgi:hypothetical protein